MYASQPRCEGVVGSKIFRLSRAFASRNPHSYPTNFDLLLIRRQVFLSMMRPPKKLFTIVFSLLSLTACKRSSGPSQSQQPNATPTPLSNTAQQTPAVSEAQFQALKQKFNEEMKDEPDNLHYNLGNIAFAAGKYDEAAAEYTQALKLNPKDADAQARLGEAYLKLDKSREALAAFQVATRLDPKQPDAWLRLGDLYRRLNRPREAVAAYKQSLAAKPEQAGVYFSLGNAYDTLKQTSDAAEAYRQAARLNPQDADAYYNLGNCLSGLHQFDEAIKAYQQATTIKPEDADSHMRLGILYLEKKDKAAATDEYNKLKTLNPKYAQELEQRLSQQ